MAKSKDRDVFASSDQPHRALLIEVKGEITAEDGNTAMASTEMFAALSLEEVIAYVRNRQSSVEIVEFEDSRQGRGTVQLRASGVSSSILILATDP